jgi:biotin operon repressor
MSYKDFLEKRETLLRHIKVERTGNAEQLANKLGFSRRTLFNYMDLLKDEGLNIKFCRTRVTYFFAEKFDK